MPSPHPLFSFFFFFNDTATTEIYTLSLHDALPIYGRSPARREPSSRSSAPSRREPRQPRDDAGRSEEHTSELQSLRHLVCRLLLEKKKKKTKSLARRRKLEIRKRTNTDSESTPSNM